MKLGLPHLHFDSIPDLAKKFERFMTFAEGTGHFMLGGVEKLPRNKVCFNHMIIQPSLIEAHAHLVEVLLS